MFAMDVEKLRVDINGDLSNEEWKEEETTEEKDIHRR